MSSFQFGEPNFELLQHCFKHLLIYIHLYHERSTVSKTCGCCNFPCELWYELKTDLQYILKHVGLVEAQIKLVLILHLYLSGELAGGL